MSCSNKKLLAAISLALIIAVLFMAEGVILFIISGLMFAYAISLARSLRDEQRNPVDIDYLRQAGDLLYNCASYAEWQDVIDRVTDFAADYRGIDLTTLPADEREAVELARQILIDACEDEDQVGIERLSCNMIAQA